MAKTTKKVRQTRRKNQKKHAQKSRHRSVGQQALRDKDVLDKRRRSQRIAEIKENMPYVTRINGQTVLVDPMACAVISAVEKHNCTATFNLNADRVAHFKHRIDERQDNPKEVAIVLINVDDEHGGPIAEALMPGQDWKETRDRNEVPFARGLANREYMEELLHLFDKAAAEKLETFPGYAVIVVDHGVAEIFSA